MANKITFTDRKLKSLPPPPPGKRRVTYSDTETKGFRIRVYQDQKVFIAEATPPTPGRPQIAVTMEPYDGTNLEKCRELARQHIAAIKAGQNPTHIKAKDSENTLYAVALAYFAAMPPKKTKRIKENAVFKSWMGMKRSKMPPNLTPDQKLIWKSLPHWVSDPKASPRLRSRLLPTIKRRDIQDIIKDIKSERGPWATRNVTTMLRPLFRWAIRQGHYGIDTNPCDDMGDEDFGLDPKQMKRKRVLTDEEFKIVWNTSTQFGVYGDLIKLFLLLGVRRSEIGKMKWSEIEGNTLLLPPEREKNGEGRYIALPPLALEIINRQPVFQGCPFVFTENEKTPFHQYDNRLKKLRALCQFTEKFTHHDLRRTVRTGVSKKLRVLPHIAEAILGHKKKGIEGTYNLWDFIDEQREVLTKWEVEVLKMVEPTPPDNVIKLRA